MTRPDYNISQKTAVNVKKKKTLKKTTLNYYRVPQNFETLSLYIIAELKIKVCDPTLKLYLD